MKWRDDGSKLCRAESLLGLQGSPVEVLRWQQRQSRVLPEAPERLWGQVSSSVGESPVPQTWRIVELFGLEEASYFRCPRLFPTGEVLHQEERLLEVQGEDSDGRFLSCWRSSGELLTGGGQPRTQMGFIYFMFLLAGICDVNIFSWCYSFYNKWWRSLAGTLRCCIWSSKPELPVDDLQDLTQQFVNK